MTVICFASGKGGVGKTTHAAGAARERAVGGRDVLMVDGDKQQNLALWASIRYRLKAVPQLPCVSIFEDMIAQVRMQKSKYDDIVIDTRGSQETNPVMYDAVQVADVVITPLRTSLFDKQTMKEMDRLIGVARSFNPALRAYILLNGVGTNAKNPRALQIRESLEALSNYNGILQTRVCQRQVFEDSAAMGLTVTEFGRDKKAAEEARAVAAEIWQ